MGCETNYANEHRIKRLEEDLRDLKNKNSDDHKEFYDRIENVEKDMIESQGDRQHITKQLNEINLNVKSLMQQPGKRYETIVTSVLTGVIGAIIGFALSGAFPM